MDKNDAIRQGLRAAGIPVQVYGTTLVNEGAQELRDMVTARRFCDPRRPEGLYLYPERRADAMQARRLFGLVAKEMHLTATSVYWLSLASFLSLSQGYGADEEVERAERAQAVFLCDFYEAGAPFPFSPQDATRLRYWIRRKFEGGGTVSLLSDTALTKVNDWWSPTFLDFIRGYTVSYAVKAST